MIKKLFALFALCAVLISCDDSDNSSFNVSTDYVCYNAVTDKNDNPSALTVGNYGLSIDFTEEIFKVAGLVSLRNDMSPIKFVANNIPFKASAKGYTFNVPTLETDNADHEITDFNGRIYVVTNHITPEFFTIQYIFEINYVVDGQYTVSTINTKSQYYGTSTATPAGGPAFVKDDAEFVVKFEDSTKVNVTLNNAQFLGAMPAMTMDIKNIPIVATEDGYVAELDFIVPSINDVPYEQFGFSNFKLTGSGTQATLECTCNFKGTPFNIQIQGSIFPSNKTEE